LAALKGLPITGSSTAQKTDGAAPTGAPGTQRPLEILGNLAEISPGAELGTVSHYDIQPVIDTYANVDGTDLGTVTRKMETIIDKHQAELPAVRTLSCAARARP